MGHMQAQVVGPTDWWEVETHEGTFWVQCEDVGREGVTVESLKDYVDVADVSHIISWERQLGFGARLSAPGYTDCTEWNVFCFEDEAREYLEEEHGYCPVCLNERDEDDFCNTCVTASSTEEFSMALDEVVAGLTTEEVMSTPGVYEAMSEAYNNDVLAILYKRRLETWSRSTKPRCGQCNNCKELQQVKERVLACANPPFSHADDDVVTVWNNELARLQCQRF